MENSREPQDDGIFGREMSFDLFVLPQPIAVPLLRAESDGRTNRLASILALKDAFEAILRVAVAVLLCDLSRGEPAAGTVDFLRMILRRAEENGRGELPIGIFANVVRRASTLARSLPPERPSRLLADGLLGKLDTARAEISAASLDRLLGKPSQKLRVKTTMDLLDGLVQWRNASTGHGVFAGAESWEAYAPDLRSLVHDAVSAMLPFAQAWRMRAGWRSWSGPGRLGDEDHPCEPEGEPVGVEIARVDAVDTLDLSPFLVSWSCSHRIERPAESTSCQRRHAFTLEGRDKGKIAGPEADEGRMNFVEYGRGHRGARRCCDVPGAISMLAKAPQSRMGTVPRIAFGVDDYAESLQRLSEGFTGALVEIPSQTGRLIDALAESRLVRLSAPAGVGKSGLINLIEDKVSQAGDFAAVYRAAPAVSHSIQRFVSEIHHSIREFAKGRGLYVTNEAQILGKTSATEIQKAFAEYLEAARDGLCLDLVIVVDGIDNLIDSNGVRLLDAIPPKPFLPDGVSILLSGRENDDLSRDVGPALRQLGLFDGDAVIEPDRAAMAEAVACYLRRDLPLLGRAISDDDVEAAIRKSHGHFLKARLIRNGLAGRAFRDISTVPEQGPDATSMLGALKDLVGTAIFRGRHLSALILMVGFGAPVTVGILSRLGLGRGDAEATLRDLMTIGVIHRAKPRKFHESTISEDDRTADPRWEITHDTVAAFALKEAGVGPERATAIVAEAATEWCDAIAWSLDLGKEEDILVATRTDPDLIPESALAVAGPHPGAGARNGFDLLADAVIGVDRYRLAIELFGKARRLAARLAHSPPVEPPANADEARGEEGWRLMKLANAFRGLNNNAAALAANLEAVNLTRDLIRCGRTEHQALLALNLGGAAQALWAMGRNREALGYNYQAVNVYRQIIDDQPQVKNDMAGWICGLSITLGSLKRFSSALPYNLEAVSLTREMVTAGNTRVLPSYASRLDNLATTLRGLGRMEEAIANESEAIRVYRELIAAGRRDLLHDLARCQQGLARSLWLGGRHVDAHTAQQEAVFIFEELVAAGKLEFSELLASARAELTKVYQNRSAPPPQT